MAIAAGIRVETQGLRSDLARNADQLKKASRTHDQLVIERDTRRRAVWLESAAQRLSMGPQAKVEDLGAP